MPVTTITIGGLNINDGINYSVSADTLTMLEAAVGEDAILVDMAYRAPVYIRSQPRARPINVGVFFLQVNVLDRKADYDVLVAASNTNAGLVPFSWTDGASTRQFLVHRNSLVPSRWFHRAELELVAPDPEPASV